MSISHNLPSDEPVMLPVTPEAHALSTYGTEPDSTRDDAVVAVPQDGTIGGENGDEDHAISNAGVDFTLPQRWPSRKRWLILIVLSLVSLMVSMSLVICTPASSAIAQEFHSHNTFLTIFYIPVPNLGQIFSSLYVGPLSERYGRVPVCHVFNLLFLLFTMMSGFSTSIGMLIVSRFLAGASIASICLNPAIAGDLFPVEKRGSAMSITSLIPILGSAVGPVAGGYITQYLSWRWTFWMMAILTASLTPLMAIVLQESYVPVLRRRALKKAGLPCNTAAAATTEPATTSRYWQGWSWTSAKSITLLCLRPFIILARSRIAIVMAVYAGLLFGYLSLLAATLATVFQNVYGFSEGQSGLIYISMTGGTLTGAIYCRFTLDYFLLRGMSSKKPESGKAPRSENRLIPSMPAMVTFPVGLFVYGWSLHAGWHWIVPTLSTLLCGFSLSSSMTPIMSYLVDIFGDRSASAIAAVLPLRYIAGAFMPLAAPPMYSRLGYGWGNSILAFILLMIVPIIFTVVVCPQRMRALTKVSQE